MKLSEWTGQPQVHIVGLFVSLMAVIAVAAFAIATLEYTKTRGSLMLTAFLVAGYFLTMLASTRIPGEGARVPLRLAAQALATVALFLLLLGLWGTPDSDTYWKATAIVTLLTIGMVCSGIVMRVRLVGQSEKVLIWISAAAAVALTGLAVVAISVEITAALYWWAFGLLVAGWVAAGLSLLMLRILRGRSVR